MACSHRSTRGTCTAWTRRSEVADDGPLKLMYLNPVGTPDYDEVFAGVRVK